MTLKSVYQESRNKGKGQMPALSAYNNIWSKTHRKQHFHIEHVSPSTSLEEIYVVEEAFQPSLLLLFSH